MPSIPRRGGHAGEPRGRRRVKLGQGGGYHVLPALETRGAGDQDGERTFAGSGRQAELPLAGRLDLHVETQDTDGQRRAAEEIAFRELLGEDDRAAARFEFRRCCLFQGVDDRARSIRKVMAAAPGFWRVSAT